MGAYFICLLLVDGYDCGQVKDSWSAFAEQLYAARVSFVAVLVRNHEFRSECRALATRVTMLAATAGLHPIIFYHPWQNCLHYVGYISQTNVFNRQSWLQIRLTRCKTYSCSSYPAAACRSVASHTGSGTWQVYACGIMHGAGDAGYNRWGMLTGDHQ